MIQTISMPDMARLLDRGAAFMEVGRDMHFSELSAGPGVYSPISDHPLQLHLDLGATPDGRQLLDLYALADRLGGQALAEQTILPKSDISEDTAEKFSVYVAHFITPDDIAVRLMALSGEDRTPAATTTAAVAAVRALVHWCRHLAAPFDRAACISTVFGKSIDSIITIPSDDPLRDAQRASPPFLFSSLRHYPETDETTSIEARIGAATCTLHFISDE